MKPSLRKILFADYISLVSLLVPVIFWLIYLDSATTQFLHKILPRANGRPLDPTVFIQIAGAASAIFIPLLFYRVSSIYRHFANADTVIGIITMIRYYKDRGRIEYDYMWRGEPFSAGNAIHVTKAVRTLVKGQEIELAVNRNNPAKALVKLLYIA